MANFQALTIVGKGLLKVLATNVQICTPITDIQKGPDKVTKAVNGIWDTGATGSVITQKVIDELGIKPIGMSIVNTASGEEKSPVYLVDLILPMKVIVQGLRVTRGKLAGADVLIGMDVIGLGDFTITNTNNKTVMSFRMPSQNEVDYVEEGKATDASFVDKEGTPLNRQQRKQLEKEEFQKWLADKRKKQADN